MPVFSWTAQRLQALRGITERFYSPRPSFGIWNWNVFFLIIYWASNLPEVSLHPHQFVACDGGDPEEDERCHAPAQGQTPAWERDSSIGGYGEVHQRQDQDHLGQRSTSMMELGTTSTWTLMSFILLTSFLKSWIKTRHNQCDTTQNCIHSKWLKVHKRRWNSPRWCTDWCRTSKLSTTARRCSSFFQASFRCLG